MVLTRNAWLNVEADLIAKETVNTPFISPPFYRLPGNPWGCYTEKRWIVKQLDSELWQYINGNEALCYWSKRKNWDDNTLNNVDWMSVGRAMREVPQAKRRWASKQMSGHFAHGSNMVRWKQCSLAECPRCNASTEDKHHITQCPATLVTTLWEEALTELKQWWKVEQTAPHLAQALVAGLQAWRHNAHDSTKEVVSQKQARIGWNGLLDGWLSLDWRSQQEAYWAQWRRQKSSKQWTVKLIKKLWNISWDLWDHCNEALHHSQNARDDILDSRINDQIQTLFHQGLQAIPRDSFAFFKTPLKTLLTKTRHYKTWWVASVEVAMWQKKHHKHGTYLLEQCLMQHWLGLDNPNKSGT